MSKTTDRIIFQVYLAQQSLRNRMKKKFTTEKVKVTPAQIMILFLLEQNNSQRMSELSRVLAIDNSTLTGLINRLEKTGFVMRKASKEDRRVYLITMTAKGFKECEKARIAIKQVNDGIKEGFSQDQIDIFKEVLQSIIQRK